MDIASPAAFRQDARCASGFHGHQPALYRDTPPHVGFVLLLKWGKATRHGNFVFTSNVDGHFQQAGFDPLRIDKCHGSTHLLRRPQPGSPALWRAAGFEPVVDAGRCELLGAVPTCRHWGRTTRPNILMSDDGEWLDERREQAARCQAWREQVRSPMVIEIGAGLNILTVLHFSQRVVRRHGGSIIRINSREPHTGGLRGVAIAHVALETISAIDALVSWCKLSR